jgi:recombination protein RecT
MSNKQDVIDSLRKSVESIESKSFTSSHSVLDYITSRHDLISRCIPEIDFPKVSRNIFLSYQSNPTLNKCSPESVIGAIIQSYQLNLELGETLGQCFLSTNKVEGKYKCQLIIGYKGLMDISIRSNLVKDLDAGIVYQKDIDNKWFTYRRGKLSFLKYNPPVYISKKEKGAKVAWFACANLTNGGFPFVILDKDDIAQSTLNSNKDNYKYWNKFPDQMELRTAYKKLFNKLPKSITLQRAVDLINLEVDNKDQGLSLDNIDIDGTINITKKPL